MTKTKSPARSNERRMNRKICKEKSVTLSLHVQTIELK